MNLADLKHFTDRRWDEDLVPRLVEYVKVPAKSPGFDASWAAHGHLQAVVKEAHAWAAAQKIKGLNLEIVALEGKTPCIFFDVPATGTFGNAKTVLFYGHLDKQPEMVGWREGLGPWKPVVEDGPPTSTCWRRALAMWRSSPAWTPAAATTSSCG
ncbi:MAG: hypothetical protein LW835_17845 [Burkholderiaceae bacterium]|nr:hypothetical protein [Burkholderiaceae bacterium]